MTGKLLGLMALLLSRREREILEIVEDLGDPHALQIVEQYHRRYKEPVEAANLVLALRRLVDKGHLIPQCRPAPKQAPFDQRVHFSATQLAAGDSHRESLSGASSGPADTGDLMRLLRLALQGAGQGSATTSREDRGDRVAS